MTIKNKISPCLWFDNNAEEAVAFYTSLFKNSSILKRSYYGDNMPLPKGTLLTATFELAGQQFMALNGGPVFKFTEAISLMVSCENQAEVDELWEKLTADGGAPSQCGWLKDKFGLSWQIVPVQLEQLMADKDAKKSGAVVQALFKMSKIIIADLEEAHKAA
jgi:predicted 3-demethylubiquinone-9 3-methyltransferase (glyoxalase superfamily)